MAELNADRSSPPPSRQVWRAALLVGLIGLLAAACSHAADAAAGPPASLPFAPAAFTSSDSVLIVSPHPDDESLCCAGLIRRALAQGARVSIIWVTGGDAFELDARLVELRLRPGPVGLRKLGERRVAEAMEAADRLGVPPANRYLLGYPDRGIQRLMLDHFFVPYRSPYTGETSVAFPNALSPKAPYEGRALDADLRKVIALTAPTYVFVASPLDAHPDHSTSGEFVMRIMGERGQLDRVYYWIVHGGFEWPFPRGLHRKLDLIPPERARDLPWMRFELTDAEQNTKLAALQAHRSQVEIMRRFLYAFVRRNEIFTRVALEPEAPVPLLTPEAQGQSEGQGDSPNEGPYEGESREESGAR
ncbi:MAG TPA: PIG-L deacetylase family protein [Steroidobacteraceae bacterium]|jgi:LmbE family N-acetylglucosaminyl deacetylase|nr:PIG-L deacetylase family protein [Steroidobacteraceae bacterium]